MSDRIDISEHTNAICEALGLEPKLVKKMEIESSRLRAHVFLADEQGSKYITDAGTVAMESREFAIAT